MSDPIPDIEPPPQPNAVSSVNSAPVATAGSFLLYLLAIVGFLIWHRFGWECLIKIIPNIGQNIIFKVLWLVPAAGILAAVLNPNAGAALAWAGFSSIASSIPVAIMAIKVLMGAPIPQPEIRTSLPA